MVCTRCGQERGLNFPPGAKKRREKATKESQRYHNWCRPCHNEVMKEKQRAVRDLLASLKRFPCIDCGRSFHPTCMDFDHRPDTEKLFTISAECGGKAFQAVMLEVAKCEIVCATCHRIRTWNRRHLDDQLSNDDIVRPARRRAEGGRNDRPRQVLGV